MTLIKNTYDFVKKAALIFAVAIIGAVALTATAQTPKFESFLQNEGGVVLPYSASGTTTNYSTTFAAQYTGTNGFFWVKAFVQTNSTVYPYVSGYSPVWTQGEPFSDIPLWANRDGTAPLAAMNVAIALPNQTNGLSTNSFKITLITLNNYNASGGVGFPALASVYNNNALNSWTFSVTNTSQSTNSGGYDTMIVSTNIPQGFLQGALGVQCQITVAAADAHDASSWTNIVTGAYNALVTNTVAGPMIQRLGISGFLPVSGN
jgi:hypothetical protein